MGNVIRWSLPDTTQVTYTYAYIYKSTSKTGVYSTLAYQVITDNTYFDVTGDNTDWYKVAFSVGISGQMSELSDPIQGGRFNGYCTIDDIRTFSSSLKSNVITDTQVYELIKYANSQINQDILIEYREEKVEYISKDKPNDINGSNSVFYVQNPYLGDYDDDGIISETDLYVYSIDSSGTVKDYAVLQVDDVRRGKFTLTEAPASGVELYITYRSSPVLLYPIVNMMVRQAAIKYVLALAYSRTDPGMVKSFRVNKVSVTGESSPSKRYMQEYSNLVSKIVSTPVKELS